MKAISIQEPWPWAIFNLKKDIENRDWPTRVRGRVLVHAGKKIDLGSFAWIENTFGVEIPMHLPVGGIVGSVEIVDCVTQSNSQWFFGKFGFVLRNPIALPFMPCRGQLGFFDVEYKAPEKTEDGALEAQEGKFTADNKC